MAFGRSNSLSINTGATNSIFAQQQQTNPSSQPPAAGGLFGSSTQQSTSAGNLFGGPAAQQPTQTQAQGGGGGLFGSNTAQPQQQTSSLFGAATSQPQQSSSLFGNTQSNAQGTQTGGSSLFGSTLNQTAQQQQNSTLFGNSQNKPATSLFGASTNPAPSSGPSLFGGSTVFGGSSAQPQTSQSGLFGSQNGQQPQSSSSAIFGLSAQNSQAPTSLLGASQYRNSQYQPFAGKLTMGQAASAAGAQPPVQGAVKINYDEMRPTTRFADCVEEIKTQLEAIDTMIQNQERFCRQIESFIPKHGEDVASLEPDVTLIREKVETTENALALDAGGVEDQRKILENDRRDYQRCERVAINLAQPLQYRYTGYNSSQPPAGADGDAAKEMDLVGHYFVPMAADLKRTLDTYASNLSEIEGHIRVIEQSTVAQAQQLASRRAGVGGAGAYSSDETVRELADTLRSFESSILGAAGLVGQCREGVNELVLGKLGRSAIGTR